MSIDFDCPSCGRTLRVDEKYAGRRGACPACAHAVDIPEDQPQLELLPEDRRTYGVVIETPAPLTPAELRPAPTASASASPSEASGGNFGGTSGGGGRGFNEGAIDPRVAQRLRDEERQPKPVSWWRRPILAVGSVELTPVWLLAVPLVAIGVLLWFLTGPAKDAHLGTPTPVFVVEVLNTGEVQKSSRVTLGAPTGTSLTGPGGRTQTKAFSVGGQDELLVTRPDTDGDFVLIEIELKQGTLNNLGQTAGYDTVIKADTFELRRDGAPAGSGSTARLVTSDFARPVDLDLVNAQTTNYHAMLPPTATVPPDRLDEEKLPGAVRGEAEYALGPTQGTVEFSANRSSGGYPAVKGLNGIGRLTMTHPQGGPRVEADYQGAFLTVSWDANSTGHWSQKRIVQSSKASPFDRYTFSLLFPRPKDKGKYTVSLAGRDLGTVKLGRMKQPSAPAPSPFASNRPGGPQPSSKNSNSPLAYFDILRDAKSRAEGIVSASNMRSIGLGLQLYLNDHKNRFPESLLDLRPYLPDLDQLMVNPRTGEHPGFIYEQPPAGAHPGTTPVLYEALGGQKDPTGAVLYGDGSIR